MNIARLAELLVGNEINTRVIDTALEWICVDYAFEGGLVYEIDQANILNLKESWLASRANLSVRDRIPIADFSPENRGKLATTTLTYCHREATPSSFEQAGLDFFQATSFMFIPLVDEQVRLCGLLLFINKEDTPCLSASDLQTLTVLTQMLARYVGTRVYQNKLAFAQASLGSILDNTGIDIYVNDFYTHEVLYANKSMAQPYGGREKFIGRRCWQVLFPDTEGPCEFCPQNELIDENGEPTKIYSWDYQRPFDGSWFRVFSAAFRWVDGRLAHVVSSANITENKLNEDVIKYMANYDLLTRLPNRRMLVTDFEKRLAASHEDDKCSLMFFDLDGFKAVNDTYGHSAGDELLSMLGDFFSSIPALKNAIYRNGGDEFVAILGGEYSENDVRALVRGIHERFQSPWELSQGPVFCNTSIGVACFPQDGRTVDALLQKADQAMYFSKKKGGGDVCFASFFAAKSSDD